MVGCFMGYALRKASMKQKGGGSKKKFSGYNPAANYWF